MTKDLERKMQKFIELISEKEIRKNKKLEGQIEFLKKYLGIITSAKNESEYCSITSLNKYFNFNLVQVGA